MKKTILLSALAILALNAAIPIAIAADPPTGAYVTTDYTYVKDVQELDPWYVGSAASSNSVQRIEYCGIFDRDSATAVASVVVTPSKADQDSSGTKKRQSFQTYTWNGGSLSCNTIEGSRETTNGWSVVCTNCTTCSPIGYYAPMPSTALEWEDSDYTFDTHPPANKGCWLTTTTDYDHTRKVTTKMSLHLNGGDTNKVYLVPLVVHAYRYSGCENLTTGNGRNDDYYSEVTPLWYGPSPDSLPGYESADWQARQFDSSETRSGVSSSLIPQGCYPFLAVNGWPVIHVNNSPVTYVRCVGGGSAPLNIWFRNTGSASSEPYYSNWPFGLTTEGHSIRVTLSPVDVVYQEDTVTKVVNGKIVAKSPIPWPGSSLPVGGADAGRIRFIFDVNDTGIGLSDSNGTQKAWIKRDESTGNLKLGVDGNANAVSINSSNVVVNGGVQFGGTGPKLVPEEDGYFLSLLQSAYNDKAALKLSAIDAYGWVRSRGQLLGSLLQLGSRTGGSYTWTGVSDGSIYYVNQSGATITIGDTSSYPGQMRTIKLIAPATNATVTTSDGSLIEGGSGYGLIGTNSFVNLHSSGSNWWVLGSSGGSVIASTTTNTWIVQTNGLQSQRIPVSQKLKNSAARSVASVKLQVYNINQTASDVYVGFYSQPGRGGTQYGTDSLASSAPGWQTTDLTFTWSNKPSLPASDVYLCVWTAGTINAQFGEVSGGTCYEDTSYCMYNPNAATWDDLMMEIKVEE